MNQTKWNRITLVTMMSVIMMTTISCVEKIEKQTTFEAKTFTVFQDDMIHFQPENPNQYETVRTSSADRGREIYTRLELPDLGNHVKITIKVELRPIPKDLVSVWDPWDRAGHVRLQMADSIDVELLKFMTAYGGQTEWQADISHLGPLLKGTCNFYAFIDTWVTPGWRMDCSLTFEPGEERNPDWVQPLFFEQDYTAAAPGNAGLSHTITVPEDLGKINLYYLPSGHCTDGTRDDEFITKDNIFTVDGKEITRLRPWRTDCRQFRAINPYGRRWSNGEWSSDFERSGWCPGDQVLPTVIDWSKAIQPGEHQVGLVITDVRPQDENKHYGYWRVSGVLAGWN
jgi:hypothetical protein